MEKIIIEVRGGIASCQKQPPAGVVVEIRDYDCPATRGNYNKKLKCSVTVEGNDQDF